jgi:hypothetical protein
MTSYYTEYITYNITVYLQYQLDASYPTVTSKSGVRGSVDDLFEVVLEREGETEQVGVKESDIFHERAETRQRYPVRFLRGRRGRVRNRI